MKRCQGFAGARDQRGARGSLRRPVAGVPAGVWVTGLLGLLTHAGCSRATPHASGASLDSPYAALQEEAGLLVRNPQDPAHPTEVDLGHVPFGEVLHHTVELENRSPAPVTVRHIRPGCSCTQPRISYVDAASGERVQGDLLSADRVIQIPPGVVAQLDLTVDTTITPVRNLHKVVVVRITSDSPQTPYLTLDVRFLVVNHFNPSPAVIDLGKVGEHGGGVGKVELARDGDVPYDIAGVRSAPLEILPQLSREEKNGVPVWTLSVRLLPPVTLGRHEYKVVLDTVPERPSGSSAPTESTPAPLEVTVRAEGAADVGFEPAWITLRSAEPGHPPSATAFVQARLEGQRLRIVRAQVVGLEPDAVEVELVPRAADDEGRSRQWEVRLIALRDLGPAAREGVLELETDDPQWPRLSARWHYRP